MNLKLLITGILLTSSVQLAAQEESKSIFQKLKEKETQNQQTTEVQLSAEELAFKARQDEQFAAFTLKHLNEFAQFKRQYNEELSAYRQSILAQWGEVEVSSNSKVVDYTEDDIKTVVDFDSNEVIVSVIHDKAENPDPKKVEQAIKRLVDVSPDKTHSLPTDKGVNVLNELVDSEQATTIIEQTTDIVRNATVEKVIPTIDEKDLKAEQQEIERINQRDKQQVEIIADKANISNEQIASVQQSISKHVPINKSRRESSSTKQKKEKLKEKRITRYKIAVKGKSDTKRVAKVKPFAESHAEKWQLPLELIIAIIHTESSFNPMAVSHIPAYGLMQIVPHSAGIDVNEFLNAKREPMTTEVLFESKQNIQAGSAYLHILDDRYLRKITHPTNRIYCVIAAYNTGVGNVARAFNDGKVRRLNNDIVDTINEMSPEQVYQTLVERLPYEETRRYLEKVKSRMTHYQKVIKSMDATNT